MCISEIKNCFCLMAGTCLEERATQPFLAFKKSAPSGFVSINKVVIKYLPWLLICNDTQFNCLSFALMLGRQRLF